MQNAVDNLIKLGAISLCEPDQNQYLSKTFLAPKPNGDKRFILNLKNFNKFVTKTHFKMEDYRTASRLIPEGGFMASIDLKESYLLVPIHPSYHKYLRFQIESNNSALLTYEFKAMPYGLCDGPRIFTKIMKEVVKHLRLNGFTSVAYLDDLLLIGADLAECKNNVNITIKLLECLGFIINYKKSSIVPQQTCKYLGFMFDSVTMTMSLPLEKRRSIAQLIDKYLKLPVCTIRDFARFLGVLTAACPAVRYGWLYTKSFERVKYLALKSFPNNYDAQIKLSQIILPDLQWWKQNIYHTVNPINIQNYDIEIYSDASLTGWGVYCNSQRASGGWRTEERNCHINYLELLAVFMGLKCFADKLTGCAILLRIDNTTAISYINRMGGIQFPHLTELTRKIWQWCEKRKLWLFASYINTKENVEADFESRKTNHECELTLADPSFQYISQILGKPTIDLFASRTNTKCEKYISWGRDPDAIAVDAFTVQWTQYFFYAFPPFPLILKTLQKVIKDKARGIIVFPYWPAQPWFPLLKQLLKSEILELTSPFCPNFRSTQVQPPLGITLAAAIVSG